MKGFLGMQSLGCKSRMENQQKTYLKLLWNDFSWKNSSFVSTAWPAVLSPKLLKRGCPVGGGNQAGAELVAGWPSGSSD